MKRILLNNLKGVVLVCLVSYPNPCLAQAVSTPAAPSDAVRAFEALKKLAGSWQGPVTVDNPAWATDKPMDITVRVVSQGTAVIHELMVRGMPEVTMFYVDGDRLTLVHYCDFKNRVRMVAQPLKDDTRIEFELVEMAGIDAPGHVSHAVFVIKDANHHTEDWTFALPGQAPFHAVMDMKRVP